MPDVAGFRVKIGVLIPSTNTIVEADCSAMHIPGVTFHTGRMYIAHDKLGSDRAFEQLLAEITASLDIALRDVLTCAPDYLIMGMSAPTFWDGKEGGQKFVEEIQAKSGLKISIGSAACRAALDAVQAKRIAVFTPAQPVMLEQIVRYFEECGFTVVRQTAMQVASATAIAHIAPTELRPVIKALDGPDIDAIVQCGTNLSMARLAAEAEGWVGKPVIAINTALLWHAYRANGFTDRLYGFGSLLSEY